MRNDGNCAVALPVDAESQSAADTIDTVTGVRPPSLSTSHDVTMESWSVTVYSLAATLLIDHRYYVNL